MSSDGHFSSPWYHQLEILSPEAADALVEEALFRLCIGYRYVERKREITDKGEKESETEKETTPSITAITLWLKTRKPEVWGDAAGELPEGSNLLEVLAATLAGDAEPCIGVPGGWEGGNSTGEV